MLSAIIFEKGLKKGEYDYLTALIEVKPDVQLEVPNNVAKLLVEFKYVMPSKMPKELPLKRKNDHMTDLIPG